MFRGSRPMNARANLAVVSAIILGMLLLGTAGAQPPQPAVSGSLEPTAQDQRQQDEKMGHMADAMKGMAETCDTMMKREMAMFPAKMAALGTLGVIGAIGLVLLVVLEVQLIRLLGLRIRQSKRDLGEQAKG